MWIKFQLLDSKSILLFTFSVKMHLWKFSTFWSCYQYFILIYIQINSLKLKINSVKSLNWWSKWRKKTKTSRFCSLLKTNLHESWYPLMRGFIIRFIKKLNFHSASVVTSNMSRIKMLLHNFDKRFFSLSD